MVPQMYLEWDWTVGYLVSDPCWWELACRIQVDVGVIGCYLWLDC